MKGGDDSPSFLLSGLRQRFRLQGRKELNMPHILRPREKQKGIRGRKDPDRS